MATPATIDVEALLAPISEEAPSGADMRADSSPSSLYFQLKDARSAARRAERAADEAGETRQINEWQTILDSAAKVLAGQSKDLEIAAWYVEALLREHGFAGLRDGFALTAEMLDRYWDSFHSLEDEDGLNTRLAPLAGLNGVDADGTLMQPLRKVLLTAPGGDVGPFSFYDYQQATTLAQIADESVRQRRIDSGAVTVEAFTSAVNASGGRFYVGLLEDLQGAIDAFDRLAAVLEARAGVDGPPTSAIHDMLGNILDCARANSRDLVAAVAPAAAEAGDAAGADAEAGPAAGGAVAVATSAGALRTREDALRVMLQLAEYFRINEPQSPISTILEETVRRGRLSFAELLAELLPDADQWRTVLTNAGIKPRES
jgi:type VI secretion system protein ImpA